MKRYRFLLMVLFAGVFQMLHSCAPQSKPTSQSVQGISDDSLLTLVQRQTFRYFWDAAEPTSGMARERIHMDGVYPQHDQDVITLGGSGFMVALSLFRGCRIFEKPGL